MKESYESYTEKLQDSYKEEFNRVEAYCNFLMKNYSMEKKEEIMSEILDTFLNAQNDKKDIKEIVGEDIDLYCRNACKIEEKNMIIIKLLTFLKNMSYWTFIIILSNSLIDKISGTYKGTVYLYQIVFGLIIALISNNVEFVYSSQFFFEKEDFKKILNRNIISIIAKIGFGIVLIMIFQDKFYISTSIVLSVCIGYIALYYLVIKNNTPEVSNTSITENMISTIPKDMKEKFEKENQKRAKSGKKNITEEEFIEKEMKKIRSNLKYEKISFIWSVVFGVAFSLGGINAGKELSDVILSGIMVFLLSLLIILKIRKSFIKAYNEEMRFLEECKNKKIKAEDWEKVDL